MVDIVPETINRIRLSDDDLKLLYRVLQKVDVSVLDAEEKTFHEILVGRVEGRMKLKENNPDL
ncbi:MAG: hypothetical protein ACQESE_04065 [Nanobdellota archaeon]